MIVSFRHKGLAAFFETGRTKLINQQFHKRLAIRLDALAVASAPEQMNLPGFDFHPLRGKPQRYTVHVNGPWCITFGWDGTNAVFVDFEQYH